MAGKKSQVRSKTSKTSINKNGFRFRPWMALVIIGLIVVVGVVIVRYSQAGSGSVTGVYYGYVNGYDRYARILYNGSLTPIHNYVVEKLYSPTVGGKLRDVDDGTCWSYGRNGTYKYQGHSTISMDQVPC